METVSLIEENPIRVCRKELHLTQVKLAKECEIHESAVLLNEQGCYPEILPSIVEFLTDQGYSGSQLHKSYHSYVRQARNQTASKLRLHNFTLSSQVVSVSPVAQLPVWAKVSRTKFAKLLCIQPAFLYRLERGELPGLPSQVELALREVGVTPLILEQINERQDEFHQWLKVSKWR